MVVGGRPEAGYQGPAVFVHCEEFTTKNFIQT